MVSYHGADGKQCYHQTDELNDAISFVERLRNDQAVDKARIFKLEELSFEFRPYFRVELATEPPPPAPVVTAGTEAPAASSEWLSAIAGTTEEPDPLAAAWSATERTDVAGDVAVGSDDDAVGAGAGRKGLFGR
jgi:hypothetical protein